MALSSEVGLLAICQAKFVKQDFVFTLHQYIVYT